MCHWAAVADGQIQAMHNNRSRWGNYGSGQRKDKGARESAPETRERERERAMPRAGPAREDEGKSEIAAAAAAGQHPICGSSFLFSLLESLYS